MNKNQIYRHTFNPRVWEAEAGKSLEFYRVSSKTFRTM